MNSEEMYAFEEEHKLPHFPPDPPLPADPSNVTRDEAGVLIDHMAEVLSVMARQDTILGDHDKARVCTLASDQVKLLGQVIMSQGEFDPKAWEYVIRMGAKLTARAGAVADKDDD